LDTLAGIKPERVGGVERRVKHRAEVFSELDWHDEDRLATLRLPHRRLSIAFSIETPLALIGPAHFLISVSTNFCRYLCELRSPPPRSAPVSCIRVVTAAGGVVAGALARTLS